jgi:uncharacterized damage-inducible protein DinB
MHRNPRTFPDGGGDERAVLTGWLDWQRATVLRKVHGRTDEQAHQTLLPTSPRTTVAGVLSHLRWTERGWFAAGFPSAAGAPTEREPSGGWDVPRSSLSMLVEQYAAECAVSRRVVSRHDLAEMQEVTPPEFSPVSLRWIVAHMIEETARHLGHLDVLREQLDVLREQLDGTRGY